MGTLPENEEFVRLWLELRSPALIAARLGLSKQYVSNRASELRRMGVELPRAGPQGRKARRLEVEKLNLLIRANEGGSIAPVERQESQNKAARKKPVWDGAIPLSLGSSFHPVWMRWLAFRRDELRKPVTQLSGDQALLELAAMGPVRAVKAIEHTIARGWQGIREPDPERKGHASASEYLAEQSNLKTLKELGLA